MIERALAEGCYGIKYKLKWLIFISENLCLILTLLLEKVGLGYFKIRF